MFRERDAMTRRLLLAALLATVAACSQGDEQNDIATVAAAGTTIGIDTTGLNTSVKPGDNFDEYANGGRSEEHTSELQSLMRISYAVFCLKKKKTNTQ